MNGIQDCAQVLAEQGVFQQSIPDFTVRESQIAMATAVADAIQFQGKLVVESGTGTGKTFAYLVPILLSKKKCIISTGTKHLQDQIFNRDLPLVKKILGINTNAMLLKGRSNYLCQYRLQQHNHQTDLIDKKATDSYATINEWAARTRQGDIAEVTNIAENDAIWQQVTSTADNCLGNKCPNYSDCFVNKAREKALKADIVVVNHHLFFSDLCLKTEGFGELLPEKEVVIFDEAHSLPEIACLFFGFGISSNQLLYLLKDIQLANKEENKAIDLAVITAVEKNVYQLQKILGRLKQPCIALTDYNSKEFTKSFKKLLDDVEQLLQVMGSLISAGETMQSCLQRCQLLQGQLYQWWENSDFDKVSWLEANSHRFQLSCTPLQVGKYLADIFVSPDVAWIFTSATLSVNKDFSSFMREIGLQDVDTACYPSPYDFPNHTQLYLPQDLPEPKDSNFTKILGEKILQITTLSSGRTFCLFTSYRAMYEVYENIKSEIKWPLLIQGEKSKQQLIESFIDYGDAVLLGTYSFWEGVDIKGDALSCVIVDKLPFASPSDPVLKKRLEICEENGDNPFMMIQIPQAVIALKQGVGRLIRSEYDQGVVVICDNRLSNKPYGKIFLESLPKMPVTHEMNDVAKFFKYR